MPIRVHDEAPDELREAIRFTAEETGFAPHATQPSPTALFWLRERKRSRSACASQR